MGYKQIDCFKIHLTILRILGVWPEENPSLCYIYLSRIFVFIFTVLYVVIYTVNFYFLPQQLEIFAEELIFYFSIIGALSKALAFIFLRDKFKKMLDMLESEVFQSDDPEEVKLIEKAKEKSMFYWKITAGLSVSANTANVFLPFVVHLIFSVKLEFPVCRYSFVPEQYEAIFLYPAYLYQSIGITSHMLYNVNIDTFLLGVMFLAMAQLDILDRKLRKVTDVCVNVNAPRGSVDRAIDDQNAVLEIIKCIKHYDAVYVYCKLIQDAFSVILFVLFSSGSCKICMCLFRFTLPAKTQYFVFLTLYVVVMTLQIMVPCWFGSRLIEKSSQITFAVYDCDWTPRCRRFKSNLRLLVERANKPIIIKGGKMFLLSLGTFTSIMNSAYSFFTLLRHMQSR
uniref:Odorant receptor n=1 Tax=Athetis lepigone TaxID=1223490 RepID=A0A1B3B770_ATHLE|nr:putative odorant receptor OR54 [Athetis lepigone]